MKPYLASISLFCPIFNFMYIYVYAIMLFNNLLMFFFFLDLLPFSSSIVVIMF